MLIVPVLLTASPVVVRAQVVAGVEAMTSTVLQKGQSSFSGLALRTQIRSPMMPQGFSLMPTIEYWRNTSNIKHFGIEATRKDATLGCDVRYDFQHSSWHPYAGVGFGIHFLSSEVDAPALGLDDASDSLIKGGASVLAGIGFGLAGRLGNIVELKYHHVPDHSQLKINWGISYKLD
jgi:hypothetical protein